MEAIIQAVNRSNARGIAHEGWPRVPPATPFVINIQMDGFQRYFNWYDTGNWYLYKQINNITERTFILFNRFSLRLRNKPHKVDKLSLVQRMNLFILTF